MGPRQLQSTIHSDFSINSNISWTQYRTGIKSLYEESTSKVDYNNHLIREYNRKIDALNHPTGLYIQPYDAGFRFKGTSITPEPASFFWKNWISPPSYTALGTSTFSTEGNNLKLTPRSGLETFSAFYNNIDGTIDASGCVNLDGFTYVGDMTSSSTSLNLSGCTKLVTLTCYSNSQLRSLDVSNCVNLQTIGAYSNGMNSINLLGCNSVTDIDVHNNQLKSINISQCINLQSLNCSLNQITSLDFSNSKNNILSIEANATQLKSINVKDCLNLMSLSAYQNSLTSVDVSGCIALIDLDLYQNSLTQISVNDILVKLNSFGSTDGSIKLTGGTSAAPSGDGSTAKAALIAKFWTVLTN